MIDDVIKMVLKNGIDASQIRKKPARAETSCLPEGMVVKTVMLSVALDGKFDTRNSILNGDGRGLGFEIDHIPRRLGLSFFAFRANKLNSITTTSPSHF